ncbi:uncharacterized protein G2W53_008529 [Senna tora]|uniref:Uncharacterized protein n=1 Tax=Senna tora TaxID=362788 RepID=A0A835CI72_9FABA|nr:uncharacterized protein G2W53_008529 [Senna tora]
MPFQALALLSRGPMIQRESGCALSTLVVDLVESRARSAFVLCAKTDELLLLQARIGQEKLVLEDSLAEAKSFLADLFLYLSGLASLCNVYPFFEVAFLNSFSLEIWPMTCNWWGDLCPVHAFVFSLSSS